MSRTRCDFSGTSALVTGAGGDARYVRCDVADEDSVIAAVQSAISGSGRLNLAVDSAGIDRGGVRVPIAEHDTNLVDRIVATRVRAMSCP